MDKFMYSDKEKGPWFALGEYETAGHALAAARASFQWTAVWVAKMREADAADIISPNFVNDLAEDLVLKHGNAVAEELTQRIKENGQDFAKSVWQAGMLALRGDEPIWIADMMHGYNPNDSVRPADFDKEMQAQISQQKTREGIAAQKARQELEAKELEEWKEKQNLPKKPSPGTS